MRAPRSYFDPTMLRDVLARVEQRLAVVGLSASAASLKAGLSADAIRNMRRAVDKNSRQGVSTQTIAALAPVLQTTVAWLLEGIEAQGGEPLVPIVGRVGADTEGIVIQTDAQLGQDMAPIPPGGTAKAAALEVVGDSMLWLAPSGSLVYFEQQHTPPTEDMIGYYVIAELEDGRVLIKRLLRGSAPGLYSLMSQVGPPIEDVRIVWAAEPTAIIPPKQAARIIRRHGEH